ncbi:MAG: hypothetical protein ACRDLL_12250, partial [Solirubrobacterales bacterium]
MIRRKTIFATAAVICFGALGAALPAMASAATEVPAWNLTIASTPTNFPPEEELGFLGTPQYTIIATNVGGGTATGPIELTDTLPVGVTPVSASVQTQGQGSFLFSCPISGQTVTCTNSGEPVEAGKWLFLEIAVEVANLPDPTVLTNSATISGGGALPVGATTQTTVTNALPAFDLVPGQAGFSASLTEADGTPSVTAGSHPYQMNVNVATPSEQHSELIFASDGGVRDVVTTLPPGVVLNPTATAARCTEAQLETASCPEASQIGNVNVNTVAPFVGPTQSPIYSLFPPHGKGASFGFDAVLVGIYVHINGGVRAGDYALTSEANDILARALNPLLTFQVQFWGDPSGAEHDFSRGRCSYPGRSNEKCEVTRRATPLLSMPTRCADSLSADVEVDSWGHPGEFHKNSIEFTDNGGSPTGVIGCNTEEFEPKLKARPTTTVADAPSGLEADLEIPQSEDVNTRATAHLRKAVVTLPEGFVLNPSSANGLDGCSSAQVGIDPGTGVANGNQPSCPDASKIGSAEVETPLLDHVLPGSV